jgi:hypothetical protein
MIDQIVDAVLVLWLILSVLAILVVGGHYKQKAIWCFIILGVAIIGQWLWDNLVM